MHRSLTLALLLLAAGPARLVLAQSAPAQTAPAPAAPADGLPARPTPFQFVNDQASLMAPAEAKKLEGGLRRYADQTGTQVVVVTVPTLAGRTAADYGRALGTAWEVGQRGKNNGVVVVVSAKERKVAIESGSGLRDKITPALTQRIIGQDFGPSFKQGQYFNGLRKGLSALMLAANPSTNPRKNAAGATPGDGTSGVAGGSALSTDANNAASAPMPQEPVANGGGGITTPVAPPASSGPGMGTLVLGALGIGGLLFLLSRLFRRSPAANNAGGGAPNFNPNQPNSNQNQPNRPGGAPNFLPGQQQSGNYGPGNNGGPGMMGGGGGGMMGGGGGMGMGGMLATGAAAAAGAYLGNRMAGGGHDVTGNGLEGGQQTAGFGGTGAGGVAGAGTAAAGGDYFSNRDGGSGGATNEPDYFSDDNNSAAGGGSGDYFSSDDNGGSSSYDDTSSADTGGGGFDGGGGGDDSGSF